MPDIPGCPPPDPNPRAPKFRMPPGACDCHAHVFGPESRYPWNPARGYTPPDAPLSAFFRMHDVLGIERGVLTQPSVYGTDNALLADALAEAGGRLLGVAAVAGDVTDAELRRLHEAGVRGVRINLADKGGNPFDSFDDMVTFSERLAPMGWHIEFLIHANEFPDLRKSFQRLAVDSVFGHMGYVPAKVGAADAGFRELVALARDGRAWIKLTGAYRVSALERPPYRDADPYARALVEQAPGRLVWGSDWPHPFFYRPMPNDADLLDQLADWAPDEELRRRILVENPEALYGFGKAD